MKVSVQVCVQCEELLTRKFLVNGLVRRRERALESYPWKFSERSECPTALVTRVLFGFVVLRISSFEVANSTMHVTIRLATRDRFRSEST